MPPRFAPLGHIALLTALLLGGCSSVNQADRAPEIALDASRDYGYVLGDRIEHTLTVRLPAGEALDLASLPQPGPINDWLVLRDSRWEPAPAGAAKVHRLHVSYQIFKGVRAPEPVSIPPLTLRLDGSDARELATPAWSFTLAPVIPPNETDETLILRDPHPPSPADSMALTRRMSLSLAGSGLIGPLFGLRAFLLRRKIRPFAQARGELRRLLASGRDAESLRHAARCLHRAFDQTFGKTLFSGQIEFFLAEHPTFAPLREQLTAFYEWSQHLFFDPVGVAIEPRTHRWLNDLASRFAAAERKAH